MKREGICRICGKHKKLTFEHVPPQSAFNSKPVFFQKSIHLLDKKSYFYGKRIRSNQGAGGYYLCENCNNLTGSYYGESYKKFAYIGMMALTNKIWASKFITFEYAIQPLNILKQTLSMFMSIDTSDQLLNLKGLSSFILDKNSKTLPEKLRVFCIDDSSSILTLLKKVFSSDDQFEVVGTASNGNDAREQLKNLKVPIFLINLMMS